MHNSQHASKLFRPLFLTVAISNIIWPEFTMAQTREFTYSATIPGPSSVALSDAIAGDGNYNATINVDNPDKPLEVYFGQTETLQKTYDIGNYSVDIYGQNTTDSSYTVFLVWLLIVITLFQ